MNVKYCGGAKDYSGYGEANRHDIAALVGAGVEVTTEIPRYSLENSEFGRLGEIASEREGVVMDYDIKILHTTPNVFNMYVEPGKYHIGRVFWETNKLPVEFAEKLTLVDEIWTGSKYNADAIRRAGVKKPIYIIPEAIDTKVDVTEYEPFKLEVEPGYAFYSIFEWTERKNPKALLEAYWREFENDDGVSLVLKTYIDNFHPSKRREIDNEIRSIKRDMGLEHYAPVYVYRNLMNRRQIYRLHRTFDCFVSTHRGEGWGIPQMEAMLMQNPVITTNCGGIHEYLTDKTNALLIPCKMVQLSGNNRNQQWYKDDQKWGDPDMGSTRKAMREAFTHQKKMRSMGKRSSQFIKRRFSLDAVGKLMRERLEEIHATRQ